MRFTLAGDPGSVADVFAKPAMVSHVVFVAFQIFAVIPFPALAVAKAVSCGVIWERLEYAETSKVYICEA